MSAHTPGPWRVSRGVTKTDPPEGWDSAVCAGLCAPVADCTFPFLNDKKGCEANARLIAAAPDLLAACKAMSECCGSADNWVGETAVALRQIEAAIQKAEGRQ